MDKNADVDSIMAEDDFIAVMEAREEKRHGKLVKLDDLKKEITGKMFK